MDSKIIMLSVLTAFCCSETAYAQRSVQTLKKNWQFSKGEVFNAKSAETVSVPHDWAIYGPFDRKNDLQVVAVEQNGEKEATEKTGRTGGLPFIGKGVYRTSFEVPDTAGKTVTLVFDGVMSNARVKLNIHTLSASNAYEHSDGMGFAYCNHHNLHCNHLLFDAWRHEGCDMDGGYSGLYINRWSIGMPWCADVLHA